MALPASAVDREYKKFVEDADGNVSVRVYLGSDIEIGAVEIKDHDGTDRLEITSSNEAKVLETNSASIKANTDNIPSDPSTEAKQDDIVTELQSLVALKDNYALQLDEAAGSLTYVGKAAIGTATSAASWQVFRIDESGDPELIITWADGNASFDNVWDNRAALSYS